MGEGKPEIYSIAAHRGFADALVAGLVPRYSEEGFGLARLTLLLPSSRTARTLSEAFIRHFGEQGLSGLLIPRMAVIGDLELNESLGPLFDDMALGSDIPRAADPTFRWLRIAELIREVRGDEAHRGSALLREAYELGRVMDRLLVEEIAPDDLVGERVKGLVGDLAGHWVESLTLFAKVHQMWLFELQERGEIDAATRRNLLFREMAARLRDDPPQFPVVAAGVTSAAPAVADLLRAISELPNGAVVLPDLDLSMDRAVWEELGSAGAPGEETPFMRGDAVTHPQYHLKLLLNRMGIARDEVDHWHRAGLGKGPPARSHAISSLFLPPEASKAWAGLELDKRRLAGVRMVECANPEEEAQAIALLMRQAIAEPEKRVSLITPDRGLASRVVQHLRRWNIVADDTAGRPLAQTPAGRVLLLLAEVAAKQAAPVPLLALLQHPLVKREDGREAWLDAARKLELKLRGPRPAAGLVAMRDIAVRVKLGLWWDEVESILAPLCDAGDEISLAELFDLLAQAGEQLCGRGLWAQEDGRSLSRLVEELRLQARAVGTRIALEDAPAALRDAMDRLAVRPPYGGHPRIAIYGLLEGRMTRADLVICAGLNEGTWPGGSSSDPVLAPAVLRALGVPGPEFSIGLSAHDLAGAMGAPEVVLSRARRDAGGPVIASRFWLRVQALLGEDLLERYMDEQPVLWAEFIDAQEELPPHPRPQPKPSSEQRRARISVTALDRLRSDPYQFYASNILSLEELRLVEAEPDAAWQGTLAHKILQDWHDKKGTLEELADQHLGAMHAHPLMRALWRPRLMKALEWVQSEVESDPSRIPTVIEKKREATFKGVTVSGKPDRIDRLGDGTLAVVDYKTGSPPSGKEVEAGYALQLGTLGLMVQAGAFETLQGTPSVFEYWSLGKSEKSETGFGYVTTPLKVGAKRSGIAPEEFLPQTEAFLFDALDRWILGEEPFTARLNPDAKVYNAYDQLMRLDEWLGREDGKS